MRCDGIEDGDGDGGMEMEGDGDGEEECTRLEYGLTADYFGAKAEISEWQYPKFSTSRISDGTRQ